MIYNIYFFVNMNLFLFTQDTHSSATRNDLKQVRMLNTSSGKWPCVKTSNCFVLGQAAQECLLCTPVCLNICTLGLGMV